MSKKIKELSIYGGTSLGWLEDAEEVERKDLLLKDLCGRLPYGVKVTWDGLYPITLTPSIYATLWKEWRYQNIPKVYLRPMSSMTGEEEKEFTKLFCKWHDDELFDYIEEGAEFSIWKHKGISPVVFDWLNAHHFDYRGLLERGLALEAPDGIYNLKEK